MTSPQKRLQKILLLVFIGETEVSIQIKAPNPPFSVGSSSFMKVKNCDMRDFRKCAKISQTLSSKFKIFTAPPKYCSRLLPFAVVRWGEKLGVEGERKAGEVLAP